MAITRITQHMMTQRSLSSLQSNLSSIADLQEKESSGKAINRPSDSISGTVSAMRLRDKLSTAQQYQTNAADADSWLGTTDNTLQSIVDNLRDVKGIGVQAVSGAIDQTALDALATKIDGARDAMLSDANADYLGRPIFGGITSGSKAYDDDGTFVGQASPVERTVGANTTVRVDTDAVSVFGEDGDNVFDHLTALAAALRSGDTSAIRDANTALEADSARATAAHSDVGVRQARVDAATSAATDSELSLKTQLSSVEDVDLPQVIVDLQMQQASYQVSLAATARVTQRSLVDYLS